MPSSKTAETNTHPEYQAKKETWIKLRDSLAGPARIKSKGKKYLPDPSSHKIGEPTRSLRYKNYIFRSVFVPFSQQTLNHILGEVYSKEAKIVLPASLMPMKDNIDGTGNTWEQQSKRVVADNISLGRAGLLTDYPAVDFGDDASKAVTDQIYPTITRYQAEEILDWDTAVDGRNTKTTYVKLREIKYERIKEEGETEFKTVAVNYIKELELIDGVYTVKTWPEDVDEENKKEETKIVEPINSEGQKLNFIPFEFIGSENNDSTVDNSPMEPINIIEHAYYLASADYEENTFVSGQCTFWVNMDQAHYDWLESNGLNDFSTGVGSTWMLGQDGEAGIIKMEASGALAESKEEKINLIRVMGGRITEEVEVQKSATEAGINDRAKKSVVITCVDNVNVAYQKAFEHALAFKPSEGDNTITVEISTDYNFNKLTADDIRVLHEMKREESISIEEFRAMLHSGGWPIEKNLEIFRDMIEGQN